MGKWRRGGRERKAENAVARTSARVRGPRHRERNASGGETFSGIFLPLLENRKRKTFFGARLASPLFSSFPWGGLRIWHLGRRRELREGAGGKKEKKGRGHGVHGVHRARGSR